MTSENGVKIKSEHEIKCFSNLFHVNNQVLTDPSKVYSCLLAM